MYPVGYQHGYHWYIDMKVLKPLELHWLVTVSVMYGPTNVNTLNHGETSRRAYHVSIWQLVVELTVVGYWPSLHRWWDWDVNSNLSVSSTRGGSALRIDQQGQCGQHNKLVLYAITRCLIVVYRSVVPSFPACGFIFSHWIHHRAILFACLLYFYTLIFSYMFIIGPLSRNVIKSIVSFILPFSWWLSSTCLAIYDISLISYASYLLHLCRWT
jgi:hypothetical protein